MTRTGPTHAIRDILDDHPEPLSLREILTRAHERGVGHVRALRALRRAARKGQVRAVGGDYYQIATPGVW